MNVRLLTKTNKFLLNYHNRYKPLHCFVNNRIMDQKFIIQPVSLMSTENKVKELSSKEKLKKAIAEYGTTVIVFHITTSLISLGSCYLLISNGVDLEKYLAWLNLSESLSSKMTTGAGTFVAAYAVHKIFAPIRISITLGSAPFIVRYLRNKGILKHPVAKTN